MKFSAQALAVFSLAIITLAGHAEAAEPAATPENSKSGWNCWYAPKDLTIRCLVTKTPKTGHAERQAAADAAYDPRLPEVMRRIWGKPGELVGRQVKIPMWTPPLDMGYARLLAESAVCGVQDHCDVAFDDNVDGLAAVRAAARLAQVPQQEVIAALRAQGIAEAETETAPADEPSAQPITPRRRSARLLAAS